MRSSCWWRKLERLLAAAALASLCGIAAPGPVPDCRPCSLRPAEGRPLYEFTFAVKSTAEGRLVEAIEVRISGKPGLWQRLPVVGMDPVPQGETFFFGGVDLNFDGCQDLMLLVRRSAANNYARYWLFDPRSGRYVLLGRYPVFRVDSEKRRLSTYERGGAAGLIYRSREYVFEGGKLVLAREEAQEPSEKEGVFRKVIRERSGGVLKTVRVESVQAP